MQSILNKISNLEKLIGNTPLIEITFKYKDRPLKIYSKIEYYNYTGSIKDRVALYIIKKAYLTGKIKEKDIVAEATSGNTGISFAAICTYLNHDVHIYMPDWLSTERIKLLESFNATLHLVSKEDGGFLKCISLIEQCSKLCSDIFLPSQFTNVDNIYAHYYSTGPEIYSSLRKRHIIPSIFVAGVGTGGTVMGIGKYLKEKGQLNGDTIVTTIMSNLGLYKACGRAGIRYEKTAVGDKYVCENMMANGYSLGGEQSGHIIFSKHATTGDGILTSLMVMEVLMDKKLPLSTLTAEVVIYPQLLKNVRVANKAAAKANPAVQKAVEDVAEALGDDGRILVRESGTEPVIRVMVEAPDDATCAKYVDQVVSVMHKEGLVTE